MTMNKDTFEELDIVEIAEFPVGLNKLLKFAQLVQSGAQAKFVISQGLVKVNGIVETQKRKKIIEGDIIEFEGRKLRPARRTSIA